MGRNAKSRDRPRHWAGGPFNSHRGGYSRDSKRLKPRPPESHIPADAVVGEKPRSPGKKGPHRRKCERELVGASKKYASSCALALAIRQWCCSWLKIFLEIEEAASSESRAQSDLDETSSVCSGRSSASSVRSLAASTSSSSISRTASTLSAQRTVSGSTATSVVSLRDLESRKAEIEQELQRVQRELKERETQERRSRASCPLALLPATARSTTSQSQAKSSDSPASATTQARRTRTQQPGSQHR